MGEKKKQKKRARKARLRKRYYFLSFALIAMAFGLVLLPEYKKNEIIKPEELLKEIVTPERYISTDELADKLINQDPSILLVDLRSKVSYDAYSLPSALNIPLDSLLSPTNEAYLNQDQFEVVFYSNDDVYSDQAWQMCRRLGYDNLHVLKGGLNEWFATIIDPKLPKEEMSELEYTKFNFRRSASVYFGMPLTEKIEY